MHGATERTMGEVSRLHVDGIMPGTEGAKRGRAVCMEAAVREPLILFAAFAPQPPWGDTTNHGGGWVVGETHREGFILTAGRTWHATCGIIASGAERC